MSAQDSAEPLAAPGEAANVWTVWRSRALAYGPLVAAVGMVARLAIGGVLAKVGHAAAPLDDAYIHFQYARAIAEGHPWRFQPGAPVTSGATSTLWPALLAPFWALGARGDDIVWAAWALSFAALGGLAWEAFQLTRRLAGHTAAVGAGAMVVAFGGFAWCATSGMEVLPFAWVIARAVRRASDWVELPGDARSPRRAIELVALAWAAVLFRPEGMVTALFVGATLAAHPRARSWRLRALSLATVVPALFLPLLWWALTGSTRTNTEIAKLLPGNPYYAGPALVAKVVMQARQLVNDLLDGGDYSAEFLPRGGAPFALAGLGAIVWRGARSGRLWRSAAVLLIALTMFAPCFYYTFLWNRLRYLWPFATGWIVGLACLARLAGDLAGLVRRRWSVLTGLACGAVVALFASRLDWVLEDVAQSASGIDRQQVALGRWALEALPADVRIGVNDTGAIAYFSERRTFDVVGLTTRGEAAYWVAGPASRLEHYERLRERAPSELPTHFIVYPEWMALDPVLGQELHEATVTDSTILGGRSMRAYVADWSALGTGERPWTPAGPILDALDVADLESEAEHAYELLGAHEGEQIAYQSTSPEGAMVLDGGRTNRHRERFVARLRPGATARGIVRLQGPATARVSVWADDEPIAALDVGEDDWVERSFEIPADVAAERTRIDLRIAGGPVTTFHYWFVSP